MVTPYDFYNYLKFWQGREYEDEAEKIALKRFLKKFSQRKSIIDIGGGFGRLAKVYAPEFEKCLLIDPSEKLLNLAKKNLKNFENIEFQKGIAENLPVKNAVFTTALMVRVLHHLPIPEKAFREVSRVLKPQGYLILEFANKIHFLARLRSYLRGDFDFISNTNSIDQRSMKSILTQSIPFLNHHPKFIFHLLEKTGFKIISVLSVSNFRHPLIKKIIPPQILLLFESILQPLFSRFYFGPSIFVLAQKK